MALVHSWYDKIGKNGKFSFSTSQMRYVICVGQQFCFNRNVKSLRIFFLFCCFGALIVQNGLMKEKRLAHFPQWKLNFTQLKKSFAVCIVFCMFSSSSFSLSTFVYHCERSLVQVIVVADSHINSRLETLKSFTLWTTLLST